MSDQSKEPLLPQSTQRAFIALAWLFVYSVAMFTLPFAVFFGVRHLITQYYPLDNYVSTVWSVVSAVIMVNLIICAYVYKAYHEKEYDEEGNEIDQHVFHPPPQPAKDKSDLDLKQD